VNQHASASTLQSPALSPSALAPGIVGSAGAGADTGAGGLVSPLASLGSPLVSPSRKHPRPSISAGPRKCRKSSVALTPSGAASSSTSSTSTAQRSLAEQLSAVRPPLVHHDLRNPESSIRSYTASDLAAQRVGSLPLTVSRDHDDEEFRRILFADQPPAFQPKSSAGVASLSVVVSEAASICQDIPDVPNPMSPRTALGTSDDERDSSAGSRLPYHDGYSGRSASPLPSQTKQPLTVSDRPVDVRSLYRQWDNVNTPSVPASVPSGLSTASALSPQLPVPADVTSSHEHDLGSGKSEVLPDSLSETAVGAVNAAVHRVVISSQQVIPVMPERITQCPMCGSLNRGSNRAFKLHLAAHVADLQNRLRNRLVWKTAVRNNLLSQIRQRVLVERLHEGLSREELM